MEQSPFREANSYSASQENAALYGSRTFIAVFIKVRHWSISWARCIQSTPFYLISL